MLKYLFLVLYYSLLIYLPSRSVSKTGVYLRQKCLKYIFKYVGKNVNIAKGVRFGKGFNISIGDNSGIGENSYLVSVDNIIIGNNVMIAPEVMILTGGHDFNDKSKLLINQKIVKKPVIIEDDVWIGARVLILPGVTISKRSIVAAGSVVTKDVQSNCIVGGNPAKVIKSI
jgi:maltose O-acetyltransferase